jgi:hypothetical protein
MRANQGKSVPITILREKRLQTLTLQVDSKKKSEVDFDELFSDGDCPLVAFAEPGVVLDLQQVEQFRDAFNGQNFGIDPKELEQMKQQMDQFNKEFNADGFKFDPKQMDELKRQMEQFRQNFKPEDFKFDQQQMNELKEMMENSREFQIPAFTEQQREEMKRRMDELKRQLEEMQSLGQHHMV